jgi:hypothetical protein
VSLATPENRKTALWAKCVNTGREEDKRGLETDRQTKTTVITNGEQLIIQSVIIPVVSSAVTKHK